MGRVTAAHARTRSPQRRSFVPALLAVVVALAVAFAALLVWQRNEQQKANRAAVAESAVALDEWDAQALGLLANPPIHLAALASPGDADGVAALRTACEEVQAHAETVAAATGPRDPAAKVPKDFPGRADVEARRTAAETGLTTYQERVAATAQTSATWCERYPLVVEAQQAQNAAIGTLDGLLAECRGSESGCVPLETDTWGQIADAVGPAYIEPAQRRAELFATGCPTEAAAGICTLVAEQSTALVPLYTAYADALRSGELGNVETARANLESTLGEQQATFGEAVRAAVPDTEVTDPAATFAALLAGGATTVDTELTQAETEFIAVIG